MNTRSSSRLARPALCIALFVAPWLTPSGQAAPQESCVTRRVSTDSAEAQVHGTSRGASLSADTRYVAFESQSADLVPGDVNGFSDVFLKDSVNGSVTLVSRGLGGAPADGPSDHATLSGDGWWIVFESEATNLVDGDTNGVRDVFLFSRQSGAITRLSVSNTGAQGNGPSGQWGLSGGSAIDHAGDHVVFQSAAGNLVSGDTNGVSDIFHYHRPSSTLVRVSLTALGGQANGNSQDPSISADGTHVAFTTDATNLVTPDGNGVSDVVVIELGTSNRHRASRSSGGNQGDGPSGRPALSSDGRLVAYESFATNLVGNDTNGTIDVFVHDTATQTTERVSVGWTGAEANNYAYQPSISADGSRVAFTSASSNLTPGGNGIQSVYVRDRSLGTTERWGQGSDGQNGFAGSEGPFLAPDGTRVAFSSLAALVPQDSNLDVDVYVRSCGPTGTAICMGLVGNCPCGNAGPPPGGCLNSTGAAGRLEGEGTASVFADSVTLTVEVLPANAPVLYFQGTTVVGFGLGVAFGDGLRCAGGSVLRLGTRLADGSGASRFGAAVPNDPSIAWKGQVPGAGGVRVYQGWYRDTAPFCTPQAFNLTDAFLIAWAP